MNVEFFELSFADTDHLTEWVGGQGWDIEFTQLSAGSQEVRYDHFAFPELLVSHYRSRQSVDTVFWIPDGMVLFLICRVKLPLLWRGMHLPPTLLAVVRSAREHWAVLPAGLDCYEFTVSEDLIRRTEVFPASFLDETTPRERSFVPLTEPVTGAFLGRLDSLFQKATGANSTDSAPVRGAYLFDFILRGLLQVVDTGLNSHDSHRLRAARRADLVSKARGFVSAHLTGECSADEMAQALGVSYRVLNYAFKDSLGISPYQYMLRQKLGAVRSQLRRSDVSIGDACAAYGFYSPSRFTSQYRRLFGELPSETRRFGRSGRA